MTIEEKNIKDVLSEIIDNVVNFWIKKSEETGLLIKHILTERLYGEVPAKKEIDYFRTESKMKFYEHYKI